MSERILVTLPEGDDVRLDQDGNRVTVWGWADPAPLTDRAGWIIIGEFNLRHTSPVGVSITEDDTHAD